MPELAEVEYYRKCWDRGLGRRISKVTANKTKRVFRGMSISTLVESLPGSILQASESHGKRMLFRFSRNGWLGIHLGMTGKLRIEEPGFRPTEHDHLVIYQKSQALVLADPRQFGRVLFHRGMTAPEWWSLLPPSLLSAEFTLDRMIAFLDRHRRLPIKAALLRQDGFPGIGNWMADEILWRACLGPGARLGSIAKTKLRTLWKTIRFVCKGAMKYVSKDFSDPPVGWFYHERWGRDGKCPRHRTKLARDTVGGRTTAWCPKCQP